MLFRSPLEKAGVFDTREAAEWRGRGYMPAPQLCATASPMTGFGDTMITVLVPFEGREAPDVTAEPGGTACAEFASGKGNGSLALTWGDGSRDTIVWTPGLNAPITAHEEIRTDASVLHTRRNRSGSLARCTALQATYCEPFAPERRPAPGAIHIQG